MIMNSRAILVGLALTFAASGVACCDGGDTPKPVPSPAPTNPQAKTPAPTVAAVGQLQKISTALAAFEQARTNAEAAQKAALQVANELTTKLTSGPLTAADQKAMTSKINSTLADFAKREAELQKAQKGLIAATPASKPAP
jgi:hypothetical protein